MLRLSTKHLVLSNNKPHASQAVSSRIVVAPSYTQEKLYYVFEYCPGGDLLSLLPPLSSLVLLERVFDEQGGRQHPPRDWCSRRCQRSITFCDVDAPPVAPTFVFANAPAG